MLLSLRFCGRSHIVFQMRDLQWHKKPSRLISPTARNTVYVQLISMANLHVYEPLKKKKQKEDEVIFIVDITELIYPN